MVCIINFLIKFIKGFMNISSTTQSHPFYYMPPEIKILIFKQLTSQDLAHLMYTSKPLKANSLAFSRFLLTDRSITLRKTSLKNGFQVSFATHHLGLGILMMGFYSNGNRSKEEAGIIYHIANKTLIQLSLEKQVYFNILTIDPKRRCVIGIVTYSHLKNKCLNSLNIWNLEGKLLHEFPVHKCVGAATFTNSNTLITQESVHSYGQESSYRLQKQILPESLSITPTSFTSIPTDCIIDRNNFMYCDEQREVVITSSFNNRQIEIRDSNSLILKELLNVSDAPLSVYVEKNGELIYQNENKHILIYNLDNKTTKNIFELTAEEQLHKLIYHEDNNHLVTINSGMHEENRGINFIRIWEIETGKQLKQFIPINEVSKDCFNGRPMNISNFISVMLYLPHLNLILTASKVYENEKHYACVYVWDLESTEEQQKPLKQIELTENLPITEISYHQQKQQLIITQWDSNEYKKHATIWCIDLLTPQ